MKSYALIELLPVESPFTVADLRKHWLHHFPDDHRKTTSLTRWLRQQCEQLFRQGILERQQPSPRKTYYQCSTNISMTHPVPPFQLDSAHQPWSELNHELTSCRRTLLSQMSELEEYRRLKDLYPELSSWLNERVEQLLEEKYRLLGKTRALETVIGAHVSAIA